MPAAACLGQDPHRVSPPTPALAREGPTPGVGRPVVPPPLECRRAATREPASGCAGPSDLR